MKHGKVRNVERKTQRKDLKRENCYEGMSSPFKEKSEGRGTYSADGGKETGGVRGEEASDKKVVRSDAKGTEGFIHWGEMAPLRERRSGSMEKEGRRWPLTLRGKWG